MLILTPQADPRDELLEQLDVEYRAMRTDLGRASSAVKRARDHQVVIDNLMRQLVSP